MAVAGGAVTARSMTVLFIRRGNTRFVIDLSSCLSHLAAALGVTLGAHISDT
jgi:hypothetical protein